MLVLCPYHPCCTHRHHPLLPSHLCSSSSRFCAFLFNPLLQSQTPRCPFISASALVVLPIIILCFPSVYSALSSLQTSMSFTSSMWMNSRGSFLLGGHTDTKTADLDSNSYDYRGSGSSLTRHLADILRRNSPMSDRPTKHCVSALGYTMPDSFILYFLFLPFPGFICGCRPPSINSLPESRTLCPPPLPPWPPSALACTMPLPIYPHPPPPLCKRVRIFEIGRLSERDNEKESLRLLVSLAVRRRVRSEGGLSTDVLGVNE
jgi:hypothetical protein